MCEFSQDPERLPCVRSSSWYPDRDFCVSLATLLIRECSFCVQIPMTPKGSRMQLQSSGLATVIFMGVSLLGI